MIRSRWDQGNLIFYTDAGVDLVKIDGTNNRLTILEHGGLAIEAGAGLSGLADADAATTAAAGVVELATDTETYEVTDANRSVTPHGLGAALARLFVISFTGSNLAGACTATGVAVDDVIFGVTGLTDMGQADSKFEAVVSVADQIQQSAAEDLHAKNFLALVYRP